MNMRTQILVVGIALIFLAVILQQVRKQKLGLRYALLWILLSVSILVMGCFPQLITVVSRLCGIQTPVNIFIGICFLLVIIFSLSTALSRNSEKLKRLTQEMGLLEERLRNIQSEENE